MGLQGVTSCRYLMCGPRRICFLSSSWRFSARLAWVSRSRLRSSGFVPDRQVACFLRHSSLSGICRARHAPACCRQVGGGHSAVDEDSHHSFAVVRGTWVTCQRMARRLEKRCVVVRLQAPLFFAAIFFQGTIGCGAPVCPKVPCDRSTFAAAGNQRVSPCAPARACIRRQRDRAWRMCRFGRDRRELRRFVVRRQPHLAGHHHAQAREWRARKTLVRTGAGFCDYCCNGEARAAGRQPPLALRSRTWRLAPRWGRARVRRCQRPSRTGRRRRTS